MATLRGLASAPEARRAIVVAGALEALGVAVGAAESPVLYKSLFWILKQEVETSVHRVTISRVFKERHFDLCFERVGKLST